MDVEFPILGSEPLPVEFANTLYGIGEQTDYLQSAAWIDEWFTQVMGAARHPEMGRHADEVRTLRDTVHALLSAATQDRTPEPDLVQRLNAYAAAAPTYLSLTWPPGGPAAQLQDTAAGPAAVLGRIAACCIELLTGPGSGDLRRCQGPGCSMFFVKAQPRRRWCHPSCGHRDRQSRYYRRHLSRGATR
ncbi:CGNR zinc finger domain-containing protein [Nonomuraea soli]|nr:CGNR zinc finger domain-containing protein [Nonomuraea soli]